jgi:hypothetical protein
LRLVTKRGTREACGPTCLLHVFNLSLFRLVIPEA